MAGRGNRKFIEGTVTKGYDNLLTNHKRPFRQVTATATAGERGASFAVLERNWKCEKCQGENVARATRCKRCRAKKPEGGGGLVHDPDTAPQTRWREAIDPSSQQMYYYHLDTNETRWDRPLEMGPAPHATGWFGRGAAGSSASKKYVLQNKAFLSRKAVKQVDRIESHHTVAANQGYEYNIWYGKYQGDDFKRSGLGRNERAPHRCVPAEHAGRTKADEKKEKYTSFCIHFARGMCAKGYDCQYYHRIPLQKDDAELDQTVDVFGTVNFNMVACHQMRSMPTCSLHSPSSLQPCIQVVSAIKRTEMIWEELDPLKVTAAHCTSVA